MRRPLLCAFALAALATFAAPSVRAQDENPKPAEEKKPGAEPSPPPERGNRGPRRGPFGIPVDEYKKELGLTDEQAKKLEDLNEELRQDFRKSREELQQSGDFDPTKMREKMKETVGRLREKVRAVLTDEQKQKYAAITKREDERMSRGPSFGPDPERMKKRLLEQAEKELTLAADEKAAVLPLVQKLLDVRAEVRINAEKRREELKNFARTAQGATDAQKAEIAAKLAEYRKAGDDDRKRIADAQSALREVLTIDNEAKLVAIGILD